MSHTKAYLSHKELSPDYPSFLPPMLVKELRQLLRTKGFLTCFLGIHGVMTLALIFALLDQDSSTTNNYGMFNGFFWALMTAMLLVITPLRGMNALSAEIDTRSIDLLLLTQLSARRIVLGKWGSLLSTGVLLALSLLPYGMLRYFFGSVDLLKDLKLLFIMLMLSAALTAVSIWSSGLIKIVRFLFPVALIVALQVSFSNFVLSRSGSTISLSFASMKGLQLLALCGCLLFLLVFFLLQASRKLTAPAVNDAPLLRSLPVIGFVLCIMITLAVYPIGPLVIAFVFMLLACAFDLAQPRELMAVHWRPWLTRSPFLRAVGYCSLPGWTSAVLFAAIGLGLFAIVGIYPPLRFTGINTPFVAYAWFLAVAWQAVVAPTVLLTCLPISTGKWGGAGFYFVTQGLMGILALFANNLSQSTPNLKAFLTFIGSTLPMSSFWLSSPKIPNPGVAPEHIFGQMVSMAGLLLLIWFHSKPSFSLLRRITLQEGPAPAPLDFKTKR